MADVESYPSSLHHVLAELARLDLFLRVEVWHRRQTGGMSDDGLSAFYIPDAEIDALLGTPAGATAWSGQPAPSGRPDEMPEDVAAALSELKCCGADIAERVRSSLRQGVPLRLVELARRFGLTPFDVDVVVICLAPEVDRRYERLYAYLHDDVTRRAPTVDLILGLLCGDLAEKVAARQRLGATAPLVRHQLVTLAPPPGSTSRSLLSQEVQLDPRVTRFLLEDDEIDDRLRPFARISAADTAAEELILPPGFATRLARLTGRADPGLVLYFQGPYGVGKQAAATRCARRWGVPLLVVATDLLADRPAEEFAELLTLIDREARLHGAAMYWDSVDALLDEDKQQQRDLLLATLASCPTPVFLAGNTTWEPAGLPDGITFLRLQFPVPGYRERLLLWRAALGDPANPAANPAPDLEDLDLESLAGRFRLSGGQIRDAVVTARHLALARGPDLPAPSRDDLFAACRLQSNRRLGALAQRITPRYTWDDIVLPPDKMEQLRAIADQVRHRALVYERWGFDRTVGHGRGLGVLFAGPSGTGKTMAADVLAHELDLDLYKIDLSTVVSKFIGETEKNLARIFAEAATSNAILFFDEADALFGKRTQVRDAHDRYANLEISYLLQRMEEHEGVVILATNLRKNMDDAFVRRLQFTIDFPVPGVAERRRIWERIWPDSAPRDRDLDLDLLAREIDVPGGNIRNIALAGAFLAAADGGVVTMSHLLRATRREYQKMGKVLTSGDVGDHAP